MINHIRTSIPNNKQLAVYLILTAGKIGNTGKVVGITNIRPNGINEFEKMK